MSNELILSPEEQEKRIQIALAMDLILANLYEPQKITGSSWGEMNNRICNANRKIHVSNSAFLGAIKALKKAGFIYDASRKEYHGINEFDTQKSIVLLPAGKEMAKDRYFWFFKRDYYDLIYK